MESYGVQIGLVLVLVLVNALFAGSEIALITLREGQIRQLEERGPGGRAVARLARDPNRFLATIQIGITLAGFLASATAAVALAQPLVEPLGFLGSAAGPVSVILVTVVLTFVTLVFGELAPKRIAMQRAEGWALMVARPLNLLATLSRPVVWLLSVSTDLVVRLTGGDPSAAREEVGEEELRDMLTAQRGMTREQRTIISGAFEIDDRRLRQVVVPRGEVFTIPAATPTAEATRMLAEHGHSRAPVVADDDLDDVLGIVHWSDLVRGTGTARDVAREAMLLPDSLVVSLALRQMTAEHQQLAVIVNEMGGIDGIVSLEDLLEEIVGEIYDETDSDIRTVVSNDDGTLTLPGTYPVHDLSDIDLSLTDPPEGDYVTVAGLVIAVLGHIPREPGETVDFGGWIAEVARTSGRTITEVRVRRMEEARPEE
ncbi:hemolysin family protein [Nocardiopsis changdeensis]|uniref:HlyC/CorC family transporter n=1 Tax=Nocardiopsis changdeensis TaxID=2831969 RepID=A0ABX8BXN9_9ACTN|nr:MULTISPECIES: hemolysin family protein [Nocardiopsis]QUX25103.1 HlyC/CorC family transporter [Nocardiopsis changdeensis]QYX35489.1 hemolysin family protein [Nocardiopsis sp. MT53]